MNRIKQIQAFFLLSIITILMFHTALPHVHHFHTNTKAHEHIHVDDHHNHDDHHHNHEGHTNHNTSDEDGFLAGLMDDLAHGVHADEYISGDNSSILPELHTHIDLSDCIIFQIEPYILSPQLEKNNLHLYALYKQGHCTNPVAHIHGLRAPPALGYNVYVS